MKSTDIEFLCLKPEVNKLWRQYFDQLQGDGEPDLLPFVKFVIEARKAGVEVDDSHIDIALPFDEWGPEVIEQTVDFLLAINHTLDVIEDDYEIKLG